MLYTRTNLHTRPNQNIKWIRQPVTFFEINTSKKLPEQLTTYVGRYEASKI